MPNINATASARFESGGILSITPQGGSLLTVLNLVPATMKWKAPFIQPIEWTDRQVIQAPLEGARVPGEVRFRARCGKVAGSELFTELNTRKAAPDGSVRLHALEAKIPAHQTGTTGEKLNTTTAYVKEMITWESGLEFDEIEFVFGINDSVAATY